MPRLICLFTCVASLAGPVLAQEQTPSPTPSPSATEAGEADKEFNDPSPDGKLAFLTTYEEDLHTIDLVDQKSGKVLQRIAETDSENTYWHVLWSPDSKRFALMERLGHPIQGVSVYFRNGDKFRKIELPDLPEAEIPEQLKHGKNFPHVANLNWQEAKKWQNDGSLVVTIDTMIDGAGTSITGTRTVVIGFDRFGKPRIEKSTIKFKTEADGD